MSAVLNHYLFNDFIKHNPKSQLFIKDDNTSCTPISTLINKYDIKKHLHLSHLSSIIMICINNNQIFLNIWNYTTNHLDILFQTELVLTDLDFIFDIGFLTYNYNTGLLAFNLLNNEIHIIDTNVKIISDNGCYKFKYIQKINLENYKFSCASWNIKGDKLVFDLFNKSKLVLYSIFSNEYKFYTFKSNSFKTMQVKNIICDNGDKYLAVAFDFVENCLENINESIIHILTWNCFILDGILNINSKNISHMFTLNDWLIICATELHICSWNTFELLKTFAFSTHNSLYQLTSLSWTNNKLSIIEFFSPYHSKFDNKITVFYAPTSSLDEWKIINIYQCNYCEKVMLLNDSLMAVINKIPHYNPLEQSVIKLFSI